MHVSAKNGVWKDIFQTAGSGAFGEGLGLGRFVQNIAEFRNTNVLVLCN